VQNILHRSKSGMRKHKAQIVAHLATFVKQMSAGAIRKFPGFNAPSGLRLASLAAVRFASQASLGQKGSRIGIFPFKRQIKWRKPLFLRT
jgi:hypothetical protein